MGLPWPADSVELYDTISFAVLKAPTSPWIFQKTDITVDSDAGIKWDTKIAKGKDGGKNTNEGVFVPKAQATILLWNRELWDMWNTMVDEILPLPGKDPRIIYMLYPTTAMLKQSRFVLEKLPTLKFKAVDMWEGTLHLIEFSGELKKSKPQPQTVAAGVGSGISGRVESPLDNKFENDHAYRARAPKLTDP